MFEKIKNIVAGQILSGAEEVKKDSKLVEDLGADSLDMVELVMAIEEAFDIEIHDDEMEDIVTVDELMNLIVKKQGE